MGFEEEKDMEGIKSSLRAKKQKDG